MCVCTEKWIFGETTKITFWIIDVTRRKIERVLQSVKPFISCETI